MGRGPGRIHAGIIRTHMSFRLPVVFTLTLFAFTASALAQTARPPSLEELSAAAPLIVRARVLEVTAQWDPAVQAIYTYATVDVSEAWKGALPSSRLVIKMLGGRVDDLELRIFGSPTLTPGDDVALWLEVRPRDGTLYPAASEAGVKYLRSADAAAIEAMQAAAASAPEAVLARPAVALPAELRAQDAFSFLPPSEGGPGRWHEADSGAAVAVDYTSPPAGLGGGLAQIDAAIAQWNGSGSTLQLQRGAARSPRCLQTFEGNGRISIAFNDPCGEIADTDPNPVVGGAYMTPVVRVVNGIAFNKIVQGVVVVNNSASAVTLLSTPGCFQYAIAHGVGHAIGLGHSDRGDAIMSPNAPGTCSSAPAPLSADDVAGVRAIYASGTTSALPGVPSGLSANVAGTTVTLSWAAGATGGAVQTYVVEAGSAPGLANLANAATGPSPGAAFAGVPPGVYYVRVRARNAVGTSAPSNEIQLSVGCDTPSAPTALAFTKSGLNVTFTWRAPATGSPIGYRFLVGSAPGLDNLLVVDQGPATGLTASGPPGTYYVRIRALSGCGVSAPSNEVIVVLP
jgi:hypothetical protein